MACNKQGADHVTWVHGDATTLRPLKVHLALMTGNVDQVFLTGQEWIATLPGIRTALTLHGYLVIRDAAP